MSRHYWYFFHKISTNNVVLTRGVFGQYFTPENTGVLNVDIKTAVNSNKKVEKYAKKYLTKPQKFAVAFGDQLRRDVARPTGHLLTQLEASEHETRNRISP